MIFWEASCCCCLTSCLRKSWTSSSSQRPSSSWSTTRHLPSSKESWRLVQCPLLSDVILAPYVSHRHESGIIVSYLWSDIMLFCFSFLAAGCIFQQSPQGAEGKIPEEPRLLTACQSAIHPPGQPGAPRVLPGDAVRTTSGPGGRVSPLLLLFYLAILCK